MKLEDLLNYFKEINMLDEIIDAFRKIKREWFVPLEYKKSAYEDIVIPLFDYVTISQPSLLAEMIKELEIKKGLKILEIGTGSGFSTSLLSYLVGKDGLIVSIEINEKAYNYAKERIKELMRKGIISNNIIPVLGNGYYGYKEYSPYDRIICHASVKEIPKYWLEQINDGIIITPVGDYFQKLMKYIVRNGRIEKEIYLEDVIFTSLKNV